MEVPNFIFIDDEQMHMTPFDRVPLHGDTLLHHSTRFFITLKKKPFGCPRSHVASLACLGKRTNFSVIQTIMHYGLCRSITYAHDWMPLVHSCVFPDPGIDTLDVFVCVRDVDVRPNRHSPVTLVFPAFKRSALSILIHDASSILRSYLGIDFRGFNKTLPIASALQRDVPRWCNRWLEPL